MPPRDRRIAAISARLTAVGLEPELKEYAHYTSIEARVPDSSPVESWSEVLAALETADGFGLADSAARGRSLWATIRKSVPAATSAAETPHEQL
ncbi:hypothetical protein GA0115240_142314 [Streptomyces sp. DvalAA-14]|uniref:hypothetical protein n=1 Tax=unclassified Streptomyces TaxID=2593676 RepID=UPI00081B5C90|nr:MULTISPECIES: hypothetical protein [unclassified Streptomyces]MYS22577.1 hypothetical protein [Streptomyces sp. SID4948]SCE18671.1 hypothetical protein GA0115240_142314 [Streptomyces sp. DvalAA-14]